ncbi:hypothetical protein MBUL_04469 (plasmid) [Methylobacterium bullatum]|uniref:Uncharacterized protein n=1 Tax=Methylobacterium bullatum TaxID=570505 RepID=A0A679JC72_9HYPH|nr:hypothetical protein MBUL_04469 [Methylobacterium bullatum]
MTYARIPDFSQPVPALAAERVPFHADPILAAIQAHDDAWQAWRAARGAQAVGALADMRAALGALVTTPSTTQFGSLALLRHLRWHIQHDGIMDALVLARAGDIARTLHLDFPPSDMPRSQVAPVLRALTAASRPASRYDGPAFSEFEAETPPGSIEPWQAVAPIRPDTPHVRALRILDGMGETLAAVAFVVAGMALVGLATLA